MFRSDHQKCSMKKDVLKTFIKLFNKVAGQTCEILKNTFLTEHLWGTASTWCSDYDCGNSSKSNPEETSFTLPKNEWTRKA